MSIHYQNQCCTSVNWTLRNNLQWNFDQNSNINFYWKDTFVNVVWWVLPISPQPQCVNIWWMKTCSVNNGTLSGLQKWLKSMNDTFVIINSQRCSQNIWHMSKQISKPCVTPKIYWHKVFLHSNLFHGAVHNLQYGKFAPVSRSEADNFGGGPETFCWYFFNFMLTIWDSRHDDLQLSWLCFKHC